MTPVETLGIVDLLDQHLAWYPLLEPQDVYKLLYQGVMGSEHMLKSPDEYSHRLAMEYESIQPDATQRMFEPVRGDGKLFRINLRPFKASRLGLSTLISPLVHTTQIIRGTKAELQQTWQMFTQLCMQGFVGYFDMEKIEHFTDLLEQNEYPVVHHSERYSQAYQPSYRLIAAQYIGETGLSDED